MGKTARTKLALTILLVLLSAILAGIVWPRPVISPVGETLPEPGSTSPPLSLDPLIRPPLGDALSRISKKPFGIKISTASSPVSPERFNGYHTGVDFEILPGEEDTAVPVMAICSGPLLMKKTAAGYGGVAVQECELEKQTVTVIYGHLGLASISIQTGTEMAAGEAFAVLGRGYSSETDQERKHLHLGIHKGASLSILGYAQNEADLDDWLDAAIYLR